MGAAAGKQCQLARANRCNAAARGLEAKHFERAARVGQHRAATAVLGATNGGAGNGVASVEHNAPRLCNTVFDARQHQCVGGAIGGAIFDPADPSLRALLARPARGASMLIAFGQRAGGGFGF